MAFMERVKQERLSKGLTQSQFAKAVGVSERTIQNWETGKKKPTSLATVESIVTVLEVSVAELFSNSELAVLSAHERGGSRAARDINELVSEVSGLFAGGELSEEDQDAAIQALNDAYWKAKKANKKYAPKTKKSSK